jgi:hypothetical protein
MDKGKQQYTTIQRTGCFSHGHGNRREFMEISYRGRDMPQIKH